MTLKAGFLNRTRPALPDGIFSVMAGYLRGVGTKITPDPIICLTPQAFNVPGQPVPVHATFTNDHRAPVTLTAAFEPGPGFRAEPPGLTRKLAPGQKYQTTIHLQPHGTPEPGPAQVRLRASLGGETITPVAAFSVGEGAALAPITATAPALDAGPGGWKALGGLARVAAIGSAGQIATGSKSLW